MSKWHQMAMPVERRVREVAIPIGVTIAFIMTTTSEPTQRCLVNFRVIHFRGAWIIPTLSRTGIATSSQQLDRHVQLGFRMLVVLP